MRSTTAIIAAMIVAASAHIAAAQGRHVNPHAGRVAGMAPAPAAAPQPVYPRRYGAGAYGTPVYGGGYGSPVVASIPVVLMPDGRIFADFGYGYEPVLRSCATAAAPVAYTTAPTQYSPPAYAAPTYSVPSYGPQPFDQPAPAQPTAADQMLGAHLGQPSAQPAPGAGRAVQRPVISACWATDAYGRVFVVRQ